MQCKELKKKLEESRKDVMRAHELAERHVKFSAQVLYKHITITQLHHSVFKDSKKHGNN
jgi:hypothetical protein